MCVEDFTTSDTNYQSPCLKTITYPIGPVLTSMTGSQASKASPTKAAKRAIFVRTKAVIVCAIVQAQLTLVNCE